MSSLSSSSATFSSTVVNGSKLSVSDDTGSVAWKTGAIKRIRMVNFMIYDDAEIRPGPALNWVIGRNGAGKSTLSAAILLCLGGDPKHLGRASDLSGFVKNGQDKARLEIELHDEVMNHPKITRVLQRGAKTASQWTLNGEKTSKDAVRKFLRDKFSTEVDNMCQFLPQDKVSMFGRLNDQQLLTETIRSGIGPEMVDEQSELAKTQEDLAKMSTTAENEKELLERKLVELEKLKDKVEHLKKRKIRKRKQKDILDKIAYVEFSEMRDKYRDSKEKVEKWLVEKKTLEKKVEAAELRCKDLNEKLKEVTKQSTDVNDRSDYNDAVEAGKKAEQLSKTYTRNMENWLDMILDAVKSKEKAEEAIEKAQIDLQKANARMEKFQGENNVNELKQRRTDLKQSLQEVKRTSQEMEAQYRKARDATQEKRRLLKRASDRMKSLKGDFQSKERIFQNLPPWAKQKAAQTWKTIEDMKQVGKLQGFVTFPLLDIGINSSEIASCFEKFVNVDKLLTIVFEEKADARYLNAFRGQDTYRVAGPMGPRHKASAKFLSSIKSRGYLDELINAPDNVLTYLRDICNIDKAIVGTKETEKLLDAISDEEKAQNLKGYTVMTASTLYRFRVSKYSGQLLIEAQSFRSDQPRLFSKLENARNREIVTQFEAHVLQLEKEVAMLEEKEKGLRPAAEKAKQEVGKLFDEAQNINTILKTGDKLKVSAFASEKKLKSSIKNRDGDALKEVEGVAAKCFITTQKTAKAVAAMVDQLEKGHAAQNNLLGAMIRTADTKAQKTLADQWLGDLRTSIGNLIARLGIDIKKRQKLKERAKHLKAAFEDRNADETRIAELSSNIDELGAKLSFINSVLESTTDDPNALTRFEELQGEVDDLRPRVQNRKENEKKRKVAFQEKLEAWTARVQNLIDQVHKNFKASFQLVQSQGYACEGAVNLEIHDSEVEKYGVAINVRFREDQPLQRLSATVQSGGERSLSTFMYLLALNEVSRVPFRVVDEINQGMDEEKERISMTHLIHSVCNPKTGGQYFLITPKLLTGLRYHRNMTIHIVFNGAGALSQAKMVMNRFLKAQNSGLKRVRASNVSVDATDDDDLLEEVPTEKKQRV